MALIKSFKGIFPEIAENVFLAENATIVGKVTIKKDANIWYNAVLRGDVGEIIIGERTNIQDGVMIHCSTNRTPTIIGADVTVGHHAIVHGCTIEGECLIGMGAIVMDEAYVPKHTIVAAGAVVLERMKLESGFLYAGIPAKKIKPIPVEQFPLFSGIADHYVENASFHKEGVKREE